MQIIKDIYVGGRWVPSAGGEWLDVRNPANDELLARVPAGAPQDVEAAVQAARAAFDGWSQTPVAERVAAVDRIRAGLQQRGDEAAGLITAQMGAPLWFSKLAQIGMPLKNLDFAARAMETLALEEHIAGTLVVREAFGVVAAITPWNFPLHQITAKIAPALVAGCTVVLKPSEVTPLDAYLLAEVIHAAGLPPGVFNLVCGNGANVGEAMALHPEVDLISFTGSTRAGRRVAELASNTLKKVTLELGGKSANILLEDARLLEAVPVAVKQCFANAGQACASLSRLLVPEHLMAEVESLLLDTLGQWPLGDPLHADTKMGPVASRLQQQRVLGFIQSGISQGANLRAGSAAAPRGFQHGAYVQPTVFTGVLPHMEIAREEIFGPVLSLMSYRGEDEAVRLANESAYGLSGGVWSADLSRAERVARRLRTGQVVLNGAPLNLHAPFGGYKHSGLGREYGRHGLEEFFQLKSLQGAG